MKMEEYINTLTEQIRCKKARDSIAQEMTNHILDQAEIYEQKGIGHDEAVEKAVHEMGDPVAAGVALDRVHRPQLDWRMLVMTLLFSIAGLFLMYTAGGMSESPGIFQRQCMYTFFSFGVIALVYFMDYSFIGRHGLLLYFIMTTAFFVIRASALYEYSFLHLHWVIGLHWVNGRMPIFCAIVYLYVPIFAGVLYQFRGQQIAGVIKSLAFVLLTGILVLYFTGSVFLGANVGLVLLAMLIFAIVKGWYQINKKVVLTVLILCCVGTFLACVLMVLFGTTYRKVRVLAFFNPDAYNNTAGYVYALIRENISYAKFFGTSRGTGDLANWMQNQTSDQAFVLLRTIFTYGIIAGIAVVAAFLCFGLRSYKVAKSQKIQLGKMVSVSCLITLMCICIEGVLMNVGLYPGTTLQFPFLSYGGSATLTYAVLIGLLMSCHRHENIVTDTFIKRKPTWHLNVKLERR